MFREDQLSGVAQPNSIQFVRLPMLGDSTVSGTRPSERCRKLLAIGKDNLAEVHQRLAVLGGIADRGNFVAGF
jgi:hypothetical protein